MEQAELYLSVTAVWLELRLQYTQVARGIPAGRYEALADGAWVAVDASEPRINTSARPLRALDVRADGAAAAALLRVGSAPLALRDAAGGAFDVGFERLGRWLYVGGDFARPGEGRGEPFLCRVALPGGAALACEAAEQARGGQRVLWLSELAPAAMAALADAVAAGASLPLERVSWG